MPRMKPVTQWTVGLLVVCWVRVRAGEAPSPPPPAAVVIRLVHPDRQAAEILKLFEGSPAPHPAAALASWKRASREPGRLGKTTEAVITFFNPEMVREWRSLHEAALQLGFESGASGVRWRFSAPRDDGTLAALVTALRLSADGLGPSATDDKARVERLGRGEAVASRGESGVVLASSRRELELRPPDLGPRAHNPASGEPSAAGYLFEVKPRLLQAPADASVLMRRAIALVRGLGCDQIEGRIAVEADRLGIGIDSHTSPTAQAAPEHAAAIDARRLSWIPAQSAAALSIAIGGAPTDIDRLFALADQVDRADPARAELAPLRVRLNLLAAASGARIEADLWPRLRGLTCGLMGDLTGPGKTGSAVLCLHLDSDAAASRVLDDVLPRLHAIQRGGRLDEQGTVRSLGRLGGKPVEGSVRGSTVVIGWGEGALAAAFRAFDHPEASIRCVAKEHLTTTEHPRPSRIGLFWPGRYPLPVDGLDGFSTLSRTLAEGPPITWVGWTTRGRGHDRIQWPALRSQVLRFLAAIPQDPHLIP